MQVPLTKHSQNYLLFEIEYSLMENISFKKNMLFSLRSNRSTNTRNSAQFYHQDAFNLFKRRFVKLCSYRSAPRLCQFALLFGGIVAADDDDNVIMTEMIFCENVLSPVVLSANYV